MQVTIGANSTTYQSSTSSSATDTTDSTVVIYCHEIDWVSADELDAIEKEEVVEEEPRPVEFAPPLVVRLIILSLRPMQLPSTYG
jgi:hypothetical protein